MKLICNQGELSEVLSIVSRAASGRTYPILESILIDATGSEVTCSATNMELAIKMSVPQIEVLDSGSILVSGKILTDIVRKLPAGKVEIATTDSGAMIKSGKSKFNLPVIPADQFIQLKEPSGAQFFVNADELKTAIKQTIFATVADDPRPFISSALFETTADKLTIVATDVNRLAVREVPISGGPELTFLLSAKSLKELMGIIRGQIALSVDSNQFFVMAEGLTVSCQLVNAQYPKYRQVIPKESSGKVMMERREFIRSLERTSLISDSAKFEITADRMFISSRESDRGEFREEVEVQKSGQDYVSGFNTKFLLEFAKAVDAKEIEMSYSDPLRPALLKAGNDDYFNVVMPMKL
ncbi:DNA polymerase-3 subunit beta [Hydrogenispora ethanolica]|jgi:DNA polymerase-3 subunit beta|uniref:Beta sliding clamp n=1 Tax=Hydrogenispora ethanolica TaxID=1082276 RepID=A0A4R1S5A7_HYDET|nr:DNA polymerase III subunit beta [Hydrogenispora ethanolica]TCL74204.1 DNA polymerase-3 subunit beta [Hydrogenispora ethanolica]